MASYSRRNAAAVSAAASGGARGLPDPASPSTAEDVQTTTTAGAGWRFGLFLGVLAGTAAGAFVILRTVPLSPEAVRQTVQAWGVLAPLAFIALGAVRPFVFLPSILLFVSAGLVFGPWLGTLYAVVGGLLAALLTFGLARGLGRDFVQGRLQGRLPARLQTLQDAEWGAGLIFVLHLVPLVPMTPVSYGAGLSRVPLLSYAAAVLGGLTPRVFAYTFFGDALLDVGSPQFVAAFAALGALILVPLMLRKRLFAGWG